MIARSNLTISEAVMAIVGSKPSDWDTALAAIDSVLRNQNETSAVETIQYRQTTAVSQTRAVSPSTSSFHRKLLSPRSPRSPRVSGTSASGVSPTMSPRRSTKENGTSSGGLSRLTAAGFVTNASRAGLQQQLDKNFVDSLSVTGRNAVSSKVVPPLNIGTVQQEQDVNPAGKAQSSIALKASTLFSGTVRQEQDMKPAGTMQESLSANREIISSNGQESLGAYRGGIFSNGQDDEQEQKAPVAIPKHEGATQEGSAGAGMSFDGQDQQQKAVKDSTFPGPPAALDMFLAAVGRLETKESATLFSETQCSKLGFKVPGGSEDTSGAGQDLWAKVLLQQDAEIGRLQAENTSLKKGLEIQGVISPSKRSESSSADNVSTLTEHRRYLQNSVQTQRELIEKLLSAPQSVDNHRTQEAAGAMEGAISEDRQATDGSSLDISTDGAISIGREVVSSTVALAEALRHKKEQASNGDLASAANRSQRATEALVESSTEAMQHEAHGIEGNDSKAVDDMDVHLQAVLGEVRDLKFQCCRRHVAACQSLAIQDLRVMKVKREELLQQQVQLRTSMRSASQSLSAASTEGRKAEATRALNLRTFGPGFSSSVKKAPGAQRDGMMNALDMTHAWSNITQGLDSARRSVSHTSFGTVAGVGRGSQFSRAKAKPGRFFPKAEPDEPRFDEYSLHGPTPWRDLRPDEQCLARQQHQMKIDREKASRRTGRPIFFTDAYRGCPEEQSWQSVENYFQSPR